jgi:hypothetical protein
MIDPVPLVRRDHRGPQVTCQRELQSQNLVVVVDGCSYDEHKQCEGRERKILELLLL